MGESYNKYCVVVASQIQKRLLLKKIRGKTKKLLIKFNYSLSLLIVVELSILKLLFI